MLSSTQSHSTLLSTLQPFIAEEDPLKPASSLHPFSSTSPDSIAFLQNLIKVSHQLSHSLNVHSAIPFSNAKLVSIARQEAALEHSLFQSDEHIRITVSALRTRTGTSYGEDIPLDPAAIPDWAVSRLEAWGTEVGMETFKEDLRENRMTVVLGGKILVLDIDFSVDGHSIDVKTVKSNYAVPANGSVNTLGSSSLDGLLAKSIRTFLVSVQQDPSSSGQQALEAERLGRVVKDHLEYLMMLDGLAALKEAEGGGIRWFCDGDALSGRLVGFAKAEAGTIASSLSMESAPLDTFLQRAHALPLPYLISPSMSFLLYLSPRTYLALLRKSTLLPTPQSNDGLPKLDVPPTQLCDQLSAHPHLKGATIATLLFVSTSGINTNTGSAQKIQVDGAFPSRPQFTLAQPEIEYTFPQLPASRPYAWILDFTSSGNHPGVLMSQSKMREVECVLDPSSGMGDLGGVGMMGFGNGLNRRSWIDMLLNPGDVHSAQSVERYTASYRSPSDAHPPLQLRLATCDEPGFVLERVKVKTMKEVWETLEVVREQCWLNEMLQCCDWVPERPTNTTSVPEVGSAENAQATETLLQALLSGTNIPNSIPVEVYLPSTFSPGLSFDVPTNPCQPPKISMTLPEKPPISGLVEIIVAYDQSRPKGVRVEVGGGIGMGLGLDMGAGIDVETLEEVVRRGGIFGLGGRVWKSSSVDA